ncbi:MAG: transglycosylase SLT domain-containing protein [Tannerella sp.]|jgi:membrane-bound lytic murein transglycosylase F|nr:transglycosylase SLT domain-containing protein [Tannerella sp.]
MLKRTLIILLAATATILSCKKKPVPPPDDTPHIGELMEVISPYDSLFRRYAAEICWDWMLIASVAYQESKFYNNLESWAGAKGLMGIMPSTARSLGIDPDSLGNPEISVRAGVKCLDMISEYYTDIDNSDERTKFILASYNAGIGHIADARSLATKYGKDASKWDGNVDEFIRLKREPEYYNDSVCKYGYLRGDETFRYVKEVMARFKLYKSVGKTSEPKSGE